MNYNISSHLNNIKHYYKLLLSKVVKIVMGTKC